MGISLGPKCIPYTSMDPLGRVGRSDSSSAVEAVIVSLCFCGTVELPKIDIALLGVPAVMV